MSFYFYCSFQETESSKILSTAEIRKTQRNISLTGKVKSLNRIIFSRYGSTAIQILLYNTYACHALLIADLLI